MDCTLERDEEKLLLLVQQGRTIRRAAAIANIGKTRCRAILRDWLRRGWYEHGAEFFCGWLSDKGERVVAGDFGVGKDGKRRKRAVKSLEFEIFDWIAGDVPDDHPQHIEFQKQLAERCGEIQARWSDAERASRLGMNIDEYADEHIVLEPIALGE